MIASLDNGEQMLELNYGAQVTPWLLVRPDMQYYIEPGAFFGKKRKRIGCRTTDQSDFLTDGLALCALRT